VRQLGSAIGQGVARRSGAHEAGVAIINGCFALLL
jgi:hypothetical protein